MMAIAYLFTSAALVFLFVYKRLAYLYFGSPLAKIANAHWTVPLSESWIERKRRTGQEVATIYALHQKYGPVVRLGPKELSVNSLGGLKTIYTGAFEKHPWYSDIFINFHTENLVGMTHNIRHARQKRMLSKIYSKSFLQDSPDLNAISEIIIFDRLLPVLQRTARSGNMINVLPLFQAVGMDFTSAYIFGTKNSTAYVLEQSEWAYWLQEYEKFKYLSRQERYGGFIETWCLDLCKRMQRSDTPSSVCRDTVAVVYKQLYHCLESDPDDRPLHLAVASELLDHLIAGHETTGITVTYIMWELSRRPALQRELYQELAILEPSLKCSGSRFSSSLPPPSVIDSLPLLDAIVKETLRLHSPAPAPLPRVTPTSSASITLEGYGGIPGGVRVSSSAYSLHRIPEIYPQPFDWMPERWLHPQPSKIHDMRRLFWPFGSGGRMCLGSNFALQEIKLVIAAVYTNYITSILDDEGIEQDHAFISLPKGRKLMLKLDLINKI
ncbi:cytochrome P450 [Aspergillus ambiguus]|uniref:cytochrome P450 n=1 Tax=Aspergillus ambiguus TaxID=176160 RepID=UPI003CCD16B0